jgi:hypothetical protein
MDPWHCARQPQWRRNRLLSLRQQIETAPMLQQPVLPIAGCCEPLYNAVDELRSLDLENLFENPLSLFCVADDCLCIVLTLRLKPRHDLHVFGLDGLHSVPEHCCKKFTNAEIKERTGEQLGEQNWFWWVLVESWQEPELVDRKGCYG